METIALGIVTSLSSSLLVELRKHDQLPVKALKVNIAKTWDVLKALDELRLQGNEMIDKESEHIKTLTKWCYDAEDLVDKLELQQHQGSSAHRFPISKGVWKMRESNEILRACNNIQSILEALNLERPQSSTTPQMRRITYGEESVLDPLIGREKDVEKITQMLISCEGVSNYGVLIVGMCGIGKSQLAQTVYNRKEIDEQFSYKVWINVKEGTFIWDDIENEIKRSIPELFAVNKLQQKFLIVFDNLLHVGFQEWHKFHKTVLTEQSKSVRIMVTSRNPTISRLGCFLSYDLGFLSNDCCEEVIKAYASHYHSKVLSEPHFLDTVKSVAKKCEGLPLVAKMFGNIILYRENVYIWDNIVKVEGLSQLPEFKEGIVPMLLSNYKDMKPELWRCVAYLSLFPAGYHFDIQDLVHLWVAECFIPLESGSCLKQIVEEYVHELRKRSIIHQSSGPMYKLHRLDQEVALLASSGTCLRLDQDHEVPSHAINEDVRHLSLFFNPENLSQIEKLRKLRTVLSLHGENSHCPLQRFDQLHKALSRVRVLSLKGTNTTELPRFIGKLKHLRYLDISFTLVERLPEDVCGLHALRFLKLKGTKIINMPHKFHKLTNLLYVDWDGYDLRRFHQPRYIGKLFRLENLPLFTAGDGEGYSIRELKEMNNLQGSIHIQNLENVNDREEACEAMLHKKRGLKKLVLEWNSNSIGSAHHEEVLMGLQPHENIMELELVKYGGKNLPDWISNLRLEKYICMESITDLSCHFPDDTDESGCFPSLESLVFIDMPQLQKLEGLQANDMPRLCNIETLNCGEMASFGDKKWDNLTTVKIDGEKLDTQAQ
ncbi:putative disease resistance RPP13-like protein 1, partial [Bienertia sinuspersici]